MPTEPFEIAMAAFVWLVASAMVFVSLRARADANHAAKLADWSRESVDVDAGVRDVRVRVAGRAGTWTRLGEADAERYGAPVREPCVEAPSADALIDDDGRLVQLDTPIRALAGTPLRRRPGAGRRTDDSGGMDFPGAIATEVIELPAGATLWIRAVATEGPGRVRLRAIRGSLALATGPSDPIPESAAPAPREPPRLALGLTSALVQLPGVVALFAGPAGTRPVALAWLAGMPIASLLVRGLLVDLLYPDGRRE